MKYKKIILSLLVIILLGGCNNTEYTILTTITDNTAETITLPEVFSNSQPMENLIKDFSVINLETTAESVLGEIEKIIATSSKIYIYDDVTNYGPAIFDINGKFIKRLGHGQAPHEIGATQNIFFDTNNNYLFVNDAANCKIAKFTENGEFESSNYLKYFFKDFQMVDNSFLSFVPSHQNKMQQQLIISEDTINKKISAWPMGKAKFKISKINVLQQNDDGININLPYDNNVYCYKNNSIIVKYKIGNKTTVNLSDFENEIMMLNEIGSDEYVYRGQCIETDNNLLLKYWTKSTNGPAYADIFYNKKTKKLTPRIDKQKSLINLIEIQGAQQGCDNVFIGEIESSLLFNIQNPYYRWNGSNPNNLISPEDMEKLKKVQPDDNPIIVLFKLKDEI